MLAAFLIAGAVAMLWVSAVDLSQHRIPNAATYPAMVACGLAASAGVVSGFGGHVTTAVAGAVSFALLLYIPHRVRPDAMGFGDVKLAVPLGFAIGWAQPAVPDALLLIGWTLAAASIIGLSMALFGAARAGRQPGRGDLVAFGPALCAASSGALALSLF